MRESIDYVIVLLKRRYRPIYYLQYMLETSFISFFYKQKTPVKFQYLELFS